MTRGPTTDRPPLARGWYAPAAAIGLAIGLAFTCAACLRPGASAAPGEPATGPAELASDAPRPAWIDRAPFALTSSAGITRAYGTASAPLPDGNDCADAALALETAASRARAALVRAAGSPGSTSEGSATIGTLRGAQVEAAWLDGSRRVVHQLVSASIDASGPMPTGDAAWLGGERPSAVAARIATAERARLDARGVCRDPHRRADYPCCGPVEQMCHDSARFDSHTPPRCACGVERGPCVHDFACEEGRCVCRGTACPCDILKCRVGQVCGDGRCY